MTAAQANAINEVVSEIHRLAGLLDVLSLGVHDCSNSDLVERAIDGAARLARAIKEQLETVSTGVAL